MRQEGVHDTSTPLKVADGLEERNDREEAVGVFRTASGQASFTSKEVDGQQVRDRTGHTDDQRTQAGGAILVNMGDERTVAGDHGVGLRADAGLLAHERAGRAQLGVKEAEAARFIPLRIIGIVLTGGGEELADGLIVEGAILADIQDGHMETKGTEEAQQRIEFRASDTTGADFDQSFT